MPREIYNGRHEVRRELVSTSPPRASHAEAGEPAPTPDETAPAAFTYAGAPSPAMLSAQSMSLSRLF